MRKLLLALILCLLTIPLQAQLVPVSSADIITDMLTYTWPDDATFDSYSRLYANDGYADEYGKSFHYIIGAASTTDIVFTVPTSTKQYSHMIVQAYTSNAGNGLASNYAKVTNGSTSLGSVDVYGTPYPFDNWIAAATQIYSPLPSTLVPSTTATTASLTRPWVMGIDISGICNVILSVSANDASNTTKELFIRYDK